MVAWSHSTRDSDQLEAIQDVLVSWWQLIVQAPIRPTCYQFYAEDVAQELVLRMIRRSRRGNVLPGIPAVAHREISARGLPDGQADVRRRF